MAEVIELIDGRSEVIMDPSDLIGLVDEYMGFEAKEYLESYIAENTCDSEGYESELKACEKEIEESEKAQKKAAQDLLNGIGAAFDILTDKVPSKKELIECLESMKETIKTLM